MKSNVENTHYTQDSVNGFTEYLLDYFLTIVNPTSHSYILDAMAGDGNLSVKLYEYCARGGFSPKHVTCMDLRHENAAKAAIALYGTNADVLQGDILEYDGPATSFHRVMLKSGNHEISESSQSTLYRSIFGLLHKGGSLTNLGFVFQDTREREEFSVIARCKDTLAGLGHLVKNRHFLMREEFYGHLRDVGFSQVACAFQTQYVLDSRIIAAYYFPLEGRKDMHDTFLREQRNAPTLIRENRIKFFDGFSVMTIPAEITVAYRGWRAL